MHTLNAPGPEEAGLRSSSNPARPAGPARPVTAQRPLYLEELGVFDRAALAMLAEGPAVRWRGGWRIRGIPRRLIAASAVARQIGMGLAARRATPRGPEVAQTAAGRALARRLAAQSS